MARPWGQRAGRWSQHLALPGSLPGFFLAELPKWSTHGVRNAKMLIGLVGLKQSVPEQAL